MPADQPTTDAHRPASRPVTRLSTAIAAALALLVLAGCGSSDKPAYCKDRSNLESAVKELPNLAKSGNLSGLQTQADTIKTDAQTLSTSAKSDFPTESSAVTSAVDSLESTIKGLPSSPSATDIAGVAINAATLLSAVKNFTDATNSTCG